jgi:hypothetical protein
VASTPGEDFARVIALARTELEQVEVAQEIDTEILTEEWTAEQFLNELERLIAEIESL